MDKEQIAALVARVDRAHDLYVRAGVNGENGASLMADIKDAIEALSRQLGAALAEGFAEAREAAAAYHDRQAKDYQKKGLSVDARNSRLDATAIRALQPKETP